MPQEWIDDDLKGAEALAYRLDLDVYGTKCGYFSDVENCRPSTACVVDMKSFRFMPIHTIKPCFSIPRQIRLIINIHILVEQEIQKLIFMMQFLEKMVQLMEKKQENVESNPSLYCWPRLTLR
jgi:hypothetical protein